MLLKKGTPLLSCSSPLDTERLLSGHFTAFCSPGWTAPVLSACPHGRDVPSLGWFFWLSSEHAPTGSHLFCTEDSISGCSSPGEASPAQRGRITSLILLALFLSIQDMAGFLGCEGTLLAHGQLVTYQYTQVFYGRASSLQPQACIDSGSCHKSGAKPHTWICWTSWGSPGPTAQVF